jgi:LPXTG-motif cell wall-anchored protein
MNLKNLARRALAVVAVTTTLAAAGNARADNIVTTPSQNTDTVLATAVVATAPRSPTATPGNTTVKLVWLEPRADRDVSAPSGARSEGGELPTTGASTWWLMIVAGVLVSVGIGLRLVEAWRRVRPRARAAGRATPQGHRRQGVASDVQTCVAAPDPLPTATDPSSV